MTNQILPRISPFRLRSGFESALWAARERIQNTQVIWMHDVKMMFSAHTDDIMVSHTNEKQFVKIQTFTSQFILNMKIISNWKNITCAMISQINSFMNLLGGFHSMGTSKFRANMPVQFLVLHLHILNE